MNYIFWTVIILLSCCLLAPNIVWLVIGSNNLDDKCSNNTPNLPTWLIVQGAVGLLYFVSLICILFFINCLPSTACYVGMGFEFILLILIGFFEIAWLIIGAIRLSEDKECKLENPILYNTTLAAIILGFIGIVSSAMSNTKQFSLK